MPKQKNKQGKTYKMKKYQKLLFIYVSLLPLDAFAMNPPDGDYNIICNTKNKGKRYLEAFPKDDAGQGEVRPKERSKKNQDQKWFIIKQGTNTYHGSNYYHIGCHTKNGGTRFLEAFPKADAERGKVRPKFESDSQDQNWFLIHEGNGLYRIGCHTRNRGTRFLEAFPTDKVTRPKIQSYDPSTSSYNPDQLWKLKAI